MTGTVPASPLRTVDPTDLDGLRSALAAVDPDGRLAPIGMRHVRIGRDALADLPTLVDEVRAPGEIVIVQDAVPMRCGTHELKPHVAELLAPLGPVRVATLGTADAPLHADATALAAADRAIAGAGCVVAIGSGTITDIAKDATHRADGIPFAVVQTAVSVNAFSDDMAVLLRDGVKRTIPSRWPDVLIADERVLVDAPPALNRAGYGELGAMFTAPADWLLASAVGMDDSYHPAAVALVRESGDRFLEIADGVAAGEPDAILELARLMTLSGMSMGIAGRTAPSSGTEHVISHLLDMSAASRGRSTAHHGAQVGIGAVLVSIAWRHLLGRLDPARPAEAPAPAMEAMRARVVDAFGHLDADGRAVEECWRDYGAKLDAWNGGRERRRQLVTAWPEHRAELDALLVEPARLADALSRAGAPIRFADLRPSVDIATARWAIYNGFLMRSRFGMTDLAFLAGLWTASFLDEVLADAASMDAGL